jgi:hypothetical protein
MEIKFDKRNYRRHSDSNKRKIKKSLQECGAGRSGLGDADDTLIAGNGVFEQAQAMGIPTRVIETDGTELVVVKRTDLRTDDDKRKLLALADNATSDNVEWEDNLLNDDFGLDVLEDWDIHIPETLSDDELNDLLVDADDNPKDPKFTIVIPLAYESELEDIKASLQVTLEEWKGCKVK